MNYRVINCSMWQDKFFRELSIEDKVIWSYLLSAPESNICGIYQIDLTYMSVNTGLPPAKISEGLKYFEEKGKAFYVEGYIILVNFLKHQALNANQKKRVTKLLTELLPYKVRLYIRTLEPFKIVLNGLEGFETLLNDWVTIPKPLGNDSDKSKEKSKSKEKLEKQKQREKQSSKAAENFAAPAGAAAAAFDTLIKTDGYDFLVEINRRGLSKELIENLHRDYGIKRLFIVFQHIYARDANNWAGLFVKLVKGGEKIPIDQEAREIAPFYNIKLGGEDG